MCIYVFVYVVYMCVLCVYGICVMYTCVCEYRLRTRLPLC